jgi:esterase/lipase
MTDPRQLDLGDWALTVLAGIVIGIISGLSTAMAWFRGSKARIYERIERVEDHMKQHHDKAIAEARDLWKIQNEHEAQLRVLTTCQDNIAQSLERMEKATEKQDEKLDELIRQKRGP